MVDRLSLYSSFTTSASSSDDEESGTARRSRSLSEYSLPSIPEASAEEEAVPGEPKRRSSFHSDRGRRRLPIGRAMSPTGIDKLRSQALGDRFHDDFSLLQKKSSKKKSKKIDINTEAIPEEETQSEHENSPKIHLFVDRLEAAFDTKRKNLEFTESIAEEHEETDNHKLLRHEDFFKKFEKTFADLPDATRTQFFSSLSANAIEEEEEGQDHGLRHDLFAKQLELGTIDAPDSAKAKLLSFVAEMSIEEVDEGSDTNLKHDGFIAKLAKAEAKYNK